jgi:hypothetical protein
MIELTLNFGGEQLTCGSELARDSVVTVDIDVECQAVIASKLAPTGFVADCIYQL